MIERGILNNRVMAYEECEIQMRQVIYDNHIWLQNRYLSMGQARDQVLGLMVKLQWMTKTLEVAIIDQPKNPEEEELGARGEVLRLRQQLAEWHRAWMCRLPPPMFPMDNSNNPPNLRSLSQAEFSISDDPSPQHAPWYTPCHFYPSTSTVRAAAPQHKINSYPEPQLLQPL
ncbi:hypothetical protein HAX54_030967 [Datura stramonium]|uniref:Uncharacterized protein n=1 Tax=Datura stramonium TaxID=4076 RepID=A0ABS8V9W0_DATST|nr:hypothetical protein [Datura stramonium]